MTEDEIIIIGDAIRGKRIMDVSWVDTQDERQFYLKSLILEDGIVLELWTSSLYVYKVEEVKGDLVANSILE